MTRISEVLGSLNPDDSMLSQVCGYKQRTFANNDQVELTGFYRNPLRTGHSNEATLLEDAANATHGSHKTEMIGCGDVDCDPDTGKVITIEQKYALGIVKILASNGCKLEN